MKVLKYVGLGVLALAVIAGGGVAFLALKPPNSRPAQDEKVALTPEAVERGRYLANNVLGCIACHSERDWTRFNAPMIPGTEGGPGTCTKPEHGFPGTVCGPNITPHATAGIGGWSDGEVIRAIREGVSRDGRALAPLMPSYDFRELSDEDVHAVVAYLRSLPPIDKPSTPTELSFPINLLVKTMPEPLSGPVAAVNRADPKAYGKYLATVASCESCHSSEGISFQGGFTFNGPFGEVTSANITLDEETGIGKYTREAFVQRFKSLLQVDPATPSDAHSGSPMPWIFLAGMSEEDLGLIYDHLKTVPPVKHAVTVRKPLTATTVE